MVLKFRKTNVIFLVILIASLFECPYLYSQNIDLDSLINRIEKTGRMKFKKKIAVKFLDSDHFKEYLSSLFDEENPVELSEKDGIFLRCMGFENKTIDVKHIRKRLLLSNKGCIYDKKSKEIVATNDYRELDFIHAILLTHELIHAAQDQYFAIPTLTGDISVFDDRRLALSAAVEGNASLVMIKDNDMNIDVLTSTSDADALLSFSPVAKLSQMSGESRAITYLSVMPYIDGLRFVNAVYNKKKWNGVNDILKHPPDSTQQILHPDKYFKNKKPIPVTIGYTPDGNEYMPCQSGVIGEYMLNILLKSMNSPNETDFALGWGGDLYRIYKNTRTPSYILVWKSLWDETEYCSHFYSDFKRFIENRFHVNFKEGNIKNNSFIAGRSESGEDYFFLIKTDKKILYARTDNRNLMNTFIYGGVYD